MTSRDAIPAMLALLALRVQRGGRWLGPEDKAYTFEDAQAYVDRVVARVRADERAKIADAIEDRLNRLVHPYGDRSFSKIPEQVFLADAYGDQLVPDILGIARGEESVADQIEREGR